jgi:hypothetical protein
MPYISQEKRSRIYTLYKKGYSTRTVTKMEKLVHHQFYEYIKRRKQLEILIINPNIVVRVLCMDIINGELFVHLAMFEVHSQLKSSDQVDISVETIRRILKDNGLVAIT